MNKEKEIRQEVQNSLPVDAVRVEIEDDETVVTLFYHEPEMQSFPLPNMFGGGGMAIGFAEPDIDEILRKLIEQIFNLTSPDDVNVIENNGIYKIVLTYNEGRSW